MFLNYLDEAIQKQWMLQAGDDACWSLDLFGEFLVLHGFYRIYLCGGNHNGKPEHHASLSPTQILARMSDYTYPYILDTEWRFLGEEVKRMEAEYKKGQDAFEQTIHDIEESYPDEMFYLLREKDAYEMFARGSISTHYRYQTHPEQEWFLNGFMNGERGWRSWRVQQDIEEE